MQGRPAENEHIRVIKSLKKRIKDAVAMTEDNNKRISLRIMADAAVDGRFAGVAGTIEIWQGAQLYQPAVEYEAGVEILQPHSTLAEAIALEMGVDNALSLLSEKGIRRLHEISLITDCQSVIDAFGRERNNVSYPLHELGKDIKREIKNAFDIVHLGKVLSIDKVKAHVPDSQATQREREHNAIDKRAKAALKLALDGKGLTFTSRSNSPKGKRVGVIIPSEFTLTESLRASYFESGQEYARKGIQLNAVAMGVESIEHPFLAGYHDIMSSQDAPHLDGFSYKLMPNKIKIPASTAAWVNSNVKGGHRYSPTDKLVASVLKAIRGNFNFPGHMRAEDEIASLLVLSEGDTSPFSESDYNRLGNLMKISVDHSPDEALRTMNFLERVAAPRIYAKDRIQLITSYVKQQEINEKKNKAQYYVDALATEGFPISGKLKNAVIESVVSNGFNSALNLILKASNRGEWDRFVQPTSVFLETRKRVGQQDDALTLVHPNKLKYQASGKHQPLKKIIACVVEAIPEKGVEPVQRLAMLEKGLASIGLPSGVDITNLVLGKGSVKHKSLIDKVANFWVNKKLPRPALPQERAQSTNAIRR